nr:hypothetical protein pmam_179 [Pithovirus mammoth]
MFQTSLKKLILVESKNKFEWLRGKGRQICLVKIEQICPERKEISNGKDEIQTRKLKVFGRRIHHNHSNLFFDSTKISFFKLI